MRLAIREAERALAHDDVPVGAVVVFGGEVIGAGHNERELREDPTAPPETIRSRADARAKARAPRAETTGIGEAARALGSWRLLDTVLYVTLEPCAMCAGAIVLGGVRRAAYGNGDPTAGAPARR